MGLSKKVSPKKFNKTKPWKAPKSNYIPKCWECLYETFDLYTCEDTKDLLCKNCAEAHDRRIQFLKDDEIFNK